MAAEVVVNEGLFTLDTVTLTVDIQEMKVEYSGCGTHRLEVEMKMDKSEAIALIKKLEEALKEGEEHE